MIMTKSERGQSLVELAISIVVLLMLLAGAVEFGIAFFRLVQLRDAAQEGALYGSINPTDSGGIESRARNSSSSPLNLANLPCQLNGDGVCVTIEYLTATVDPCPGDGIRVTVSYNHKIFMPFVAAAIGRPKIPLSAQVTHTILTSANTSCVP
jgi:Flp pilus assembly protein TadG